ncbi:MAG: two-component sensor histidine kinase [Candidatus Saccharibacteria bacterium]|nr:two-component sensor histidine kinase [Candidatus Saccharibacteria bacterium]
MNKAITGQAGLFKGREQSVVFNHPKDKIMATIDSKFILMVLENVLDNAGKYSKPGEIITITMSQDETDTLITIQDHGVGIRKIDVPKLFKKFSRIDNSLSAGVKGTGLGLYWAKKIIDLHGGNISVISRQGQGSTFKISLPTTTLSQS